MKISYDPEIDALYIRLLRGKHECRSIRLSEEVPLNIGPGEKLLGIEILDARSILGSDKMPSVVLEGLKSANVPLTCKINRRRNTARNSIRDLSANVPLSGSFVGTHASIAERRAIL